ncbi:PAS domain-containing serine/threonine-protein kinase-like isoform X1 [Haliotis cracherodii]|uniref:PAS domain-containing serine/threonine-protein kinase-like isoform X1 n=2 Tax=Haliotis cracherodii TaxID=6455 RepID=UPI0039EA7DD6
MADNLKRVAMSTPKSSKGGGVRCSLPDDPHLLSPDIFGDRLLKSSPALHQKSQLNNKHLNITGKPIFMDKMVFGSPSYPSPLDRVRTGRRDRALQMGIAASREESFEANQSFPKVTKSKLQPDIPTTPVKLKNFQCDGLNDVSFSPGLCKGSFAATPDPYSSGMSLNQSWSFYNYIGGGQSGMAFPTTVRNPNKAICTIDANTSEILVANEMACELFSYEQDELLGRRLRDLIHLKPRDQQTMVESHLELNGELIDISGKVVDAVDSNGLILPVSMWVKKLEILKEPRCLCVMEPVERTVATVKFNTEGCILSCDQTLASLYGFPNPEEISGLHMKDLIPAFKCPVSRLSLDKDTRKQRATGRTRDGSMFPLSIVVKPTEEDRDRRNIPPDEREEVVFTGVVWVFANISGMITFLPDGTIHSVNDNFARMLFGYSQEELVGKDISCLIPDFYDILDLDDGIPLPPLDDEDEEEIIPFILKPDILQGKLETPVKENGERCDLLKELCVHKPGVTSTPKIPTETSEHRQDEAKESKMAITGCSNKNNSQNGEIDKVLSEMDKLNISAKSVKSPGEPEEDLSGSYLEDKDMSYVSESTEELLSTTPPQVDFNKSSDTDSCISEDSQRVESSQDGNNGDISNEIDTSGDVLAMSSEKGISCQKRKQKDLLMELQKQIARKHEINNGDISSSSAEGSYSQFGEQMTNLLPLYMNKTLDSTGDTHLDEESSYFSRDGLESHPSTDSSGSVKSAHSRLSEKAGGDKPQQMSGQVLDETCNSNHSNNSFSARPSSRQSGTQTSYTECPSQFPEGSFTGQCRHKDGHRLGIIFQLKRVELDDGQFVYCMWTSRDPEEPGEGGRSYASLTLASSLNSTLDKSNMSLGELLADKANSESKTNILDETEADDDAVEEEKKEEIDMLGSGLYDEIYDTHDCIGKGAFGFVKLGCRKKDKEEVVVKFIRRGKVLKDCWVFDDAHGRIPMEVSLLLKLNHPNIVNVIDVFQNEEFVQMVMEKHGSGMDLFEFIDRNPTMDESLASFIFRQMVAGVSYLHSKNIVHRDIKDENIIVDERFRIKLIDFGAATYMRGEKLFGTFCGTLEYCSPEVLLGNKYRGPELEMWSMGVTLYTLVFGENPFFDVEETIQSKLKPPFGVSRSLMFLVTWMLHRDPVCRATIKDVERNAWVKQEVDIQQYKWEEVLPNSEFHGNNAADNRPDSPSDVPPANVPGFKPYQPDSDDSDLQEKLREVLEIDTHFTTEYV